MYRLCLLAICTVVAALAITPSAEAGNCFGGSAFVQTQPVFVQSFGASSFFVPRQRAFVQQAPVIIRQQPNVVIQQRGLFGRRLNVSVR